MNKRQLWLLIAIFAAGLVLRLALVSQPGYERDIQLFKIWGRTAAESGVANLYDKTWCDYPPGYLYVLKGIGQIYRVFYPAFEEKTYLFDLLIKLPGILSDLLIGLVVFWFLRRKIIFRLALMMAAAWLFNPVAILNSAVWGQVDALPALFALLAVILLLRRKDFYAWALLAAAILIKTQMFILLPVFLLITWRRRGWRALINGFCGALCASIIVLLPFILSHKVDQVLERVLNAVGEYPQLSMNAYNFWWLVGWGHARNIFDANYLFGFVTYRAAGVGLLFLFMVLLLKYLYKKSGDEMALISACGLALFGFFMLPTEIHERYIVLVLPFLLLPGALDRRWLMVFIVLSLTSFLNLCGSLAGPYPNNLPPLLALSGSWSVAIIISIINVGVLMYITHMFWTESKIKLKIIIALVTLSVVLTGTLFLVQRNQPIYLSDREPSLSSQQWGTLHHDRSVDNNQLTVNGFIYAKGLGTHANSSIVYDLERDFRFLDGWCGLDNEQNRSNKISFKIMADGRPIYDSGTLQGWLDPRHFQLPISGVKKLELIVSDGGDGINFDHADWLGLRLIP